MADRLEGLKGESQMNVNERAQLLNLIPQEGQVLELGTADGVTVAWLAKQRPEVRFVSVDSFPGPGDGVKGKLGSHVNWFENRQRNQHLWVGDAASFLCYVGLSAVFHVSLIDTEHTLQQVTADLEVAASLTKRGGWIVAHDYGRPTNGVKQAVDEWRAERGLRIMLQAGTLACVLKDAGVADKLRALGYA